MAVHLTSISSTFFVNLLNRLGVKPPPADGFDLINTVQPVSIVDVDVAIPVSITPPLIDTVFSTGEQAAPAIGTVLADTGALAAGNYTFMIAVGTDGVGGTERSFRVQRRDAANATNIWTQIFSAGGGTSANMFELRCVLAANERIRVTVGPTAMVGVCQASIWTGS